MKITRRSFLKKAALSILAVSVPLPHFRLDPAHMPVMVVDQFDIRLSAVIRHYHIASSKHNMHRVCSVNIADILKCTPEEEYKQYLEPAMTMLKQDLDLKGIPIQHLDNWSTPDFPLYADVHVIYFNTALLPSYYTVQA